MKDNNKSSHDISTDKIEQVKTSTVFDVSFWALFSFIFLLGAVLRLWLISDQILLDDEWHAINMAIGNSFWDILTFYTHIGANSTPLNLYAWFLFKTFGLSEMLLRLPALFAGILSLVVLPIFVLKIFNKRVTLIFSFLLTISPFLIFYSRLFRPYSIFVLLGLVSVLSFYLWLVSGERKYVIIYMIAGPLAVYFHLFAVIALLTPLACAFLLKLPQRFPDSFLVKKMEIVPKLSSLFSVSAYLAFMLLLISLPIFTSDRSIAGEFHKLQFPVQAFIDSASLLIGTTNNFFILMFLGLIVAGLTRLLQKKALLGLITLVLIVLYLSSLLLLKPQIQVPIIFCRFSILLFPISFLLAAFGMEEIFGYLGSLGRIKSFRYSPFLLNLSLSFFLISLFLTSPLWKIYTPPNNFTNHSAFQESYSPPSWEKSYGSDFYYLKDSSATGTSYSRMRKSDIPHYYNLLARNTDKFTIIEYPMMLGDHYNLYYYYQHFHKKKIMIGYITKLKKASYKNVIFGNTFLDDVLSHAEDTKKLRFRNMINMLDLKALKRSKARFIILHKNLVSEMFPEEIRKKGEVDAVVYRLYQGYKKFLGQPFFEDDKLAVFRIPN